VARVQEIERARIAIAIANHQGAVVDDHFSN
jgi:hypothetical protein